MKTAKKIEKVISDESLFPMDSIHKSKKAVILRDEGDEENEDTVLEYLNYIQGI